LGTGDSVDSDRDSGGQVTSRDRDRGRAALGGLVAWTRSARWLRCWHGESPGGRRWLTITLVLLALTTVAAGTVVADALSGPGSDSTPAKLAEWGRDHGLGVVITWLETWRYDHDQPAVGGRPAGGIPGVAGEVPTGPGASRGFTSRLDKAPLAPLAVGPRLPGEGQWRTVVASAGLPAVQVTGLRVDAQHTAFVAGVMQLDPALVKGALHPGARDPGGSWQAPDALSDAATHGLAAVFNGGFRLTDPSHPGYYSEGRTVAPLRDGLASLVLYKNGVADVGTWNHELRMSQSVASVRQNLLPLVDHGQVNPACATGGPAQWGSTIGQAAFIHRSGFGVTATGAEIYVGGPALSVCTLGHILTDAGVVRGMELDINPNWVSGAYFHDRPHGQPTGFRLFPDEKVAAGHYFSPSSRDFYTWTLRTPGPTSAPHPARTNR
jgi:hypothetical protein